MIMTVYVYSFNFTMNVCNRLQSGRWLHLLFFPPSFLCVMIARLTLHVSMYKIFHLTFVLATGCNDKNTVVSLLTLLKSKFALNPAVFDLALRTRLFWESRIHTRTIDPYFDVNLFENIYSLIRWTWTISAARANFPFVLHFLYTFRAIHIHN